VLRVLNVCSVACSVACRDALRRCANCMTHTIGRQNHNNDSYLDVTSVDDVKDKTFLSRLAGWLRREQPITLSINADPSVDGCVRRSISLCAQNTRPHMLPPYTSTSSPHRLLFVPPLSFETKFLRHSFSQHGGFALSLLSQRRRDKTCNAAPQGC
jgi:hypothetical protein